jgi:uncharacterized protein YjbI with pentapeptide repeats
MANDDHIAQLLKEVVSWNAWRDENDTFFPDLSGADLRGRLLAEANLREANLREANLIGAKFGRADLSRADLSRANLFGTDLSGAKLIGAKLGRADLNQADLSGADLSKASLFEADLSGANFKWANLSGAKLAKASLIQASLFQAKLIGAKLPRSNLSGALFSEADLSGAYLWQADLSGASLRQANLVGADLSAANLSGANLSGANLSGANIEGAILVNADLRSADLTGCRIFGVSAWRVQLDSVKQQNLIITPENEPEISIDNIEVAQFVYLLLHNQKIRDVIDTIGKKGVLLLGRFTEGRIEILERLRTKLRELGFVPMVFNFDKPETKDFTETVRLLANLSHFVIVDITNPRSAPLELQAAVPDYMVPFVPILEEGQAPFAMFVDLQNKYDWVLKPVIAYPSIDRLIEVLEDKIVEPAKAKFNQLLARRTEQLRVENI